MVNRPRAGRGSRAVVLTAAEKKELLRGLRAPEAMGGGEGPRRRSAEIVLSSDELAFLGALSRKELEKAPLSEERQRRLELLDRMQSWGRSRAELGVVVALTAPEADWLNRVTRDVYSFITTAERRARLILREKLHRAMECPAVDESADVDEETPEG